MNKLFLPLLLLLFLSCEEESFNPSNPNVGEFVQLLHEGKYKPNITDPLPQFRSYDIPALLKYSNDFTEVPYFHTNLISSYSPAPLRQGECLLWTIEAIRQTPPTSEELIFPSLAPVLILEEAPEGSDGRLSKADLLKVHQLYLDWWEKKAGKNFQELQNIDPLAGSGYRWR